MVKVISLTAGRAKQLADDGASVCAVARRLGVCWRTARKLINFTGAGKKREVCGKVSLRRGVVKALALEMESAQGIMWPRYPSSASIAAALDNSVSKFTVCRDLRAMGFAPRVRRKVPTKDPKVFKKRLDMAKLWVSRDPAIILFSDEHTSSCNDHSTRTQWVRPGDPLTTRLRKRMHNTVRLSMWGAIGVGFKRLVLLPEVKVGRKVQRLNSQVYIDHCLSTIFRGTTGRVFMQDGARPHAAKRTLQRLRKESVVVFEGWPPYSPDLNPIEDLWALLNIRVSNLHPTTAAELEHAVKHTWNSMRQSTVDNFCRSFPARLARCIERHGVP
jgi:transposase